MSQSTVTEKRTVITSSSTSGGSREFDSLEDIPYKSNLGTRSSNVLSRTSLPSRSSTGGSSIVRTIEYGYGHAGSTGGFGPGGYGNVSSTGVSSVKNTREREKKDLQDLNERFANYIEKVRFLEAQNRKLGSELDELRSKWGKETSHIKQMYEAELTEARRLIDDLSKDKAALEIKFSSIQEQNADVNRQLDEVKKYRQVDRETINKLNQQIADLESEINMLRRSLDSLETERQRDKSTINRLQQEVDKLRIDLNNETLAHLDAENRRQTLEEEMEFMKKVHEQELKELAALAYRDTTAENREFWKNELGQAIRDIQQEYDAKVEQLRGDMEGFYNLKIQEFRTGATKQNMEVTHIREENKKITKQMSDLRGKLADMEARNAQLEKQYHDVLRELETKETDHMMEVTQFREEISKLRTEMEGILQELQTLMDAKLSLELEICAYRKLLEGEENRVDWRSRASLIMYRDAFKPSRPTYERREPETRDTRPVTSTRDKSPVVEDPVVEKAVTKIETSAFYNEPKDASPDTDAASNITMSDHDEPEDEVAVVEEIEQEIVQKAESNLKSENAKDIGDDEESAHVIVKREVEKIESRAKDLTDGQDEDQSPEEEEKDSQTEDETQDDTALKGEESNVQKSAHKDDINNDGKTETEEMISRPIETDIPEHTDIELTSSNTAQTKDQPPPIKDEDNDDTIEEMIEQKTSAVTSAAPIQSDEDRKTEQDLADSKDKPEDGLKLSDIIPIETKDSSDDNQRKDDISELKTIAGIRSEDSAKCDTNLKDEQTNDPTISPKQKPVSNQEPEQSESNGKSIVNENSTKASVPGSLLTEKTEDKVLETVVTSEIIQKETATESAIVEESPTKEMPDKLISDMTTDKTTSEENEDVKEKTMDTGSIRVTEKVDTVDAVTVDPKVIELKENEPMNDKKDVPITKIQDNNTEVITNETNVIADVRGDDTIKTEKESNVDSVEAPEKGTIKEESKDLNTNVTKQNDDDDSSEIKVGNTDDNLDLVEVERNKKELVIQVVESTTEDKRESKDMVVPSDNQTTVEQSKSDLSQVNQEETESKEYKDDDNHSNLKERSDEQTENVKVDNNENQSSIKESKSEPGVVDTSVLQESTEKDELVNTSENIDDKIVDTKQNDLISGGTDGTDTTQMARDQSDESSMTTSGDVGVTEKDNANELAKTNENIEMNSIEPITPTEERANENGLNIQENESNDQNKTNNESIAPSKDTNVTTKQITDTKALSNLNGDDKTSSTGMSNETNNDVDNDNKTSTDGSSPNNKTTSESQSEEPITDDQTKNENVTTESKDGSSKDSENEIDVNSKFDNKQDVITTDQSEIEIIKDSSNEKGNDNESDIKDTSSISKDVNNTESKPNNDKTIESVLEKDNQPQADNKSTDDKEGVNGMDDNNDNDNSAGHGVNGKTNEEKPAETNTDDAEIKKIEQLLTNGSDSAVSMKMMRGEVSAKTTYQKTATGPVSISEVSPEGKYVMLENTSSGPNRRDMNLENWQLRRKVDGKREYIYPFRNFTLKAGKKVKILARGSASEAGLNDLVFRDEENWGVGQQVNTCLVNDKEEEKASHIQKTLYN